VASARGAIGRYLHAHDPDRSSLKAALRTAIVMPATFAFADNVIAHPQTTIFAAFASFSMLVLADARHKFTTISFPQPFPRPRRARLTLREIPMAEPNSVSTQSHRERSRKPFQGVFL
jgi:hypothetical protein